MDENLEDLREEFLKNGGHEITDAITVIKFMLSKGFSRRPELDRAAIAFMIQETISETHSRDEGSDMIDLVDKYTAKFTAPEVKQGLSVEEIENVLDVFRVFEDSYTQTDYKNARKHLAQAIHDAQPASSVNAEVVKALKNCAGKLQTYVESGNPRSPYKDGINPFYVLGSKEALKDAEQALNSIKAGKDTKCS